MTAPRISISFMAGIVALTGLALACLLYASSPWARVAILGYFVALGAAPLGITYRRGNRQAFYLGFTIWVWIYFVLTSITGSLPHRETHELLGWVYPKMIMESRQPDHSPSEIIEIPNMRLEGGQRIGELIGVVDFLVKGETSPLLVGILVQNAHISGDKVAEDGTAERPRSVRLTLNCHRKEADRISEALDEGKSLRVVPHQPGRWPPGPLPVDPTSFIEVGHALLGLMVGVIGGLLGRWFYLSRGPEA